MKSDFNNIENILTDLNEHKSNFYDSKSLPVKIDEFILSLLVLKESGENIPSKLHLVKFVRSVSDIVDLRTAKFLLDIFIELDFVNGDRPLLIISDLVYNINYKIIFLMVKHKMDFNKYMRLNKIKTIQKKINA